MKYLKCFEAITSNSYATDKDFIKRMEDSITGIFVDMMDDGYDINYHLTDYAGNIGSVSFKCEVFANAKPLSEYFDLFRTLQEYLRDNNYDFHYISLRGWIINPDDNYKRCQSFRGKDWQFVENMLMIANSGGRDDKLYNIIFNVISTK